MSKIHKIEAMIPKQIEKKKVAAYARESALTEMTQYSFSAQVNYYSALIQKNPNWKYVGVYADKGITGRSIKKRKEFNRLIDDCNNGKIDLILTKSVSRFARDTVDTLNTIRHLKNIGVATFVLVVTLILNRSKNTANASPRRAVKFIPRTPGMNLSSEKVCRNEVYNEFKWN